MGVLWPVSVRKMAPRYAAMLEHMLEFHKSFNSLFVAQIFVNLMRTAQFLASSYDYHFVNDLSFMRLFLFY